MRGRWSYDRGGNGDAAETSAARSLVRLYLQGMASWQDQKQRVAQHSAEH